MDHRRDVRETFDRIGEHFAKTRPAPWPEIESFLAERTGRHGLDIGIGNARHAEVLAKHVECVVGLDISKVALRTGLDRARKRGFTASMVQGDAAMLPFRNHVFDIAVYIATIHHLPSRELRVASLNELARVLESGGAALVSAWSTAHDRFDADTAFDTTVDWRLPSGELVERFYHIYDLEEFRADIAASHLEHTESFTSSGNCFAIVQSH